MADEGKHGRLLPAIVTFVVVSGAVFLAGVVGTWLLRHVVLPLLALILGFAAARIVYKVRD
jgi:zinc transporter ZupT